MTQKLSLTLQPQQRQRSTPASRLRAYFRFLLPNHASFSAKKSTWFITAGKPIQSSCNHHPRKRDNTRQSDTERLMTSSFFLGHYSKGCTKDKIKEEKICILIICRQRAFSFPLFFGKTFMVSSFAIVFLSRLSKSFNSKRRFSVIFLTAMPTSAAHRLFMCGPRDYSIVEYLDSIFT